MKITAQKKEKALPLSHASVEVLNNFIFLARTSAYVKYLLWVALHNYRIEIFFVNTFLFSLFSRSTWIVCTLRSTVFARNDSVAIIGRSKQAFPKLSLADAISAIIRFLRDRALCCAKLLVLRDITEII